MRHLLAILFLLAGCDAAVAWCVAEGGEPDQCAAQWGEPAACEPVLMPDGSTCCAPGTGTIEQPQCGR